MLPVSLLIRYLPRLPVPVILGRSATEFWVLHHDAGYTLYPVLDLHITKSSRAWMIQVPCLPRYQKSVLYNALLRTSPQLNH